MRIQALVQCQFAEGAILAIASVHYLTLLPTLTESSTPWTELISLYKILTTEHTLNIVPNAEPDGDGDGDGDGDIEAHRKIHGGREPSNS